MAQGGQPTADSARSEIIPFKRALEDRLSIGAQRQADKFATVSPVTGPSRRRHCAIVAEGALDTTTISP
jgi:hypothetical protein